MELTTHGSPNTTEVEQSENGERQQGFLQWLVNPLSSPWTQLYRVRGAIRKQLLGKSRKRGGG